MGRVHSIETGSAVDGPGLRTVVFLQGCPLRCKFCHNPDTWDFSGGQESSAEEIAQTALRLKRFYGLKGGVTFSGGEPLAQAAFVRQCMTLLHQNGVCSAVDTGGGVWNDEARAALDECDLVLLDIKHSDPDGFEALTGRKMDTLCSAIKHLKESGKLVWVRQVVVPGLTDSDEQLQRVKERIKGLNVQKIELLPYHTLGVHKWRALGIPYGLEGVKAPDESTMARLRALL